MRLAKWINPGCRWMWRLRLGTKISAVVGMLLVPLLVLQVTMVLRSIDEMDLSQRERDGTVLVGQLGEVVGALQRWHDTLASGDATASQRQAARQTLRDASARLDQRITQTSSFDIRLPWQPHQQALQALLQQHPDDRPLPVSEVSSRIDGLLAVMGSVADRSGLLFDPEPLTYYLMDLCTERVPVMMASLRAMQWSALQKEPVDAQRFHMAYLRQRQMMLQERLEAVVRYGGTEPPVWAAVKTAVHGLGEQIDSGTASREAAALADAHGALVPLHQDLLHALRGLLEARLQTQRWQLACSLVISVAGLLLMLYLAVSFFTSFQQSVRAVTGAVQAIAHGHLDHHVAVPGRDELADTGQVLERMVHRLSSLVADIRSSAARVGMTGTQVADDGQALASRTEAQAAGLRQSLNSVQQLTEAAGINADAVQRLNTLTAGLRQRGEGSIQLMQETKGSIQVLEQSARRVAEINGVIDDIAFQTNLLALNASVEASRAGEAGKGFGVVATEVRQLAQRCSEAAQEVRTLIDHTNDQVQEVAVRVQGVGETLGQMVGGVSEVSQQLDAIASASGQQSQDLTAVAAAVSDLETITRENAQAVTRSSQASAGLVEQSQELQHAVGSMRLRQGGADEARALVERALQRIGEVGWDAAVKEFNAPGNDYVDRDLYLYAMDHETRYLVQSAKPEHVGKSLFDLKMPNPGSFLSAALDQLAQGPGWIDYPAYQLTTGRIETKSAFLAPLEGQRFLGCGFYRQAQGASAAGASRTMAPAASRTNQAVIAA